MSTPLHPNQEANAVGHTPGPWFTVPAYGGGESVLFVSIQQDPFSKYRGPICDVQDGEHIGGITAAERDANARLIAAAPELLAALIYMRMLIDNNVPMKITQGWAEEIDQTDAVIAKAKGVQ